MDDVVTVEGRLHEMSRSILIAARDMGVEMDALKRLWSTPALTEMLVRVAMGTADIVTLSDEEVAANAVRTIDRIEAVNRSDNLDALKEIILSKDQPMAVRINAVNRIYGNFDDAEETLMSLVMQIESATVTDEILRALSRRGKIILAIQNPPKVVWGLLQHRLDADALERLVFSKRLALPRRREAMIWSLRQGYQTHKLRWERIWKFRKSKNETVRALIQEIEPAEV